MNVLRPISLLILLLALVGCGASSSPVASENGKFAPVPGFSRDTDDDEDAGDGDVDGDGEDIGDDDDDDDGDGDGDGDGGGDDVGPISCGSFSLVIANEGVTSARVWFNGDEVASPGDFPSTEEIRLSVHAVNGDNVLALWLAGAPGSVLGAAVLDETGATWLDASLTRTTGAPNEAEHGLAVACE